MPSFLLSDRGSMKEKESTVIESVFRPCFHFWLEILSCGQAGYIHRIKCKKFKKKLFFFGKCSLYIIYGGITVNDRKTIKNIITGETESVEVLIQKYYEDVYTYCYRHLFDKNMAQDITQETFLHLLKNLGSYKHMGKLKNYLYVIAKNIIKDYLKKSDRMYLANIDRESESYDIENTVLEVHVF